MEKFLNVVRYIAILLIVAVASGYITMIYTGSEKFVLDRIEHKCNNCPMYNLTYEQLKNEVEGFKIGVRITENIYYRERGEEWDGSKSLTITEPDWCWESTIRNIKKRGGLK